VVVDIDIRTRPEAERCGPRSDHTSDSAVVVTSLDLDLDVVRIRATGEVRVLDEDEFDLHQVRYSYRAEVIDAARASADWLAAALADREPFTDAYRRWLG
jgi:protein associated with RNAse G/E